jgi:hypothetical protein
MSSCLHVPFQGAFHTLPSGRTIIVKEKWSNTEWSAHSLWFDGYNIATLHIFYGPTTKKPYSYSTLTGSISRNWSTLEQALNYVENVYVAMKGN